jgi:predicted GIY-YIG superfamily endonuclease
MKCVIPTGCLDAERPLNPCFDRCWVSRFKPSDQQRIKNVHAKPMPTGPTIEVPTEKGHYVYVHRDAKGRPLYVGRTTNPASRVLDHVAGSTTKSPWWSQVRRIDWERYPTAEAAHRVENERIAGLAPRHNKRGIPSTEDAA